MSSWYDAIRNIKSLGSTSDRPGSLGGLAEARRKNLAQFFTPDDIASLMWSLISGAMDRNFAETGQKTAILDNSVGTGRLFQYANPTKHILLGFDVHKPSIAALAHAVDSAGFDSEILNVGLESVKPKRIGAVLLNPPFSVTLESPFLDSDLPCTTFGRFGPSTSAISHVYALEQALSCADVVIALLPQSYVMRRLHEGGDTRLVAVIHLPPNSFKEEGTSVDVSLMVFNRFKSDKAPQEITLKALFATLPDFKLSIRNVEQQGKPRLVVNHMENTGPTILGEVTGDNVCRIVHSGRKIHLKTSCAFTRARVLNAVYRKRRSNGDATHVYPESVKYAGQGLLDVELHAAQENPLDSIQDLMRIIIEADAHPVIDPGLVRHIQKRHRLRKRQLVPLHSVSYTGDVQIEEGQSISVVAKDEFKLNPRTWVGAFVTEGESHQLTLEDGLYSLTIDNETLRMSEDQARARFDFPKTGSCKWTKVNQGRAKAFPEIASSVLGRMKKAGIENVTNWGFQIDDILEASIAPGVVNSWEMGCGKTRFLLSMALLGGKRNLIVVEAHLIDELVKQIKEVGLSASDWQQIKSPEHCRIDRLKKINIITYSRLKMALVPGANKTYASALRHKLSRVLCDEAHLLRNFDTAQTRAVWQLSPRSRYSATGTPVSNYSRDLLGLAQWTLGDGVCSQPYGRFHPTFAETNIKSLDYAERGATAFMNRHCAFEWVTHEFEHSGMSTGAKREIPKIENLGELRKWVSRFILRRTTQEPDVIKHFSTPEFSIVETQCNWDTKHLGHFLRVADTFNDWYKETKIQDKKAGRTTNLVSLLARIGAVLRAGNFPQHCPQNSDAIERYLPLTSKHREVLARAQTLASQGHKTIIYVDQPEHAEMFARHLNNQGINAFSFHGQQTIAYRSRLLNSEFINGTASVMVATIGVTQTGLNLHMADRALFACWNWSYKTISQAMGRLLRPQQKNHVVFEFFTLPGSLDDYQKQLCQFKKDASQSLIDLLEPECSDTEFLHLDRLIDDFVSNLAQLRGLSSYQLRDQIKAA